MGVQTARPGVQDSARQPPSRRAMLLTAAVVILLAAAVVGAVLASRSYGPVEFRGGSITHAAGPGVDYRTVEPIDPGGATAFAVDHNEAGTFELGFDVTNTGRLPLTLGAPEDDSFMDIRLTLRISEQDSARSANVNRLTYVPVEGVTIAPGEHRRLVATFRWSRCEDAASGGGRSARAIPVRYGAVGGIFTRNQYVEPPSKVVLVCGDLPRPNGDLITDRG